MTQFAFLSADFPELLTHAQKAEKLALSDPRDACLSFDFNKFEKALTIFQKSVLNALNSLFTPLQHRAFRGEF